MSAVGGYRRRIGGQMNKYALWVRFESGRVYRWGLFVTEADALREASQLRHCTPLYVEYVR